MQKSAVMSASSSQPEIFEIANYQEWPKWIKTFEKFREISGLNKKSQIEQISAFLGFMGNQVVGVLNSLGLSEEDRKDYGKIVEALTEYFAKFNQEFEEKGEIMENLNEGSDNIEGEDRIAQKYKKKRWILDVMVGNVTIKFKIDTGADVTCISEETFKTHFANNELRSSIRRLFNAEYTPMKLLGFFYETLKFRNNEKMCKIYVLSNLAKSLLDGNACEDLGILKLIGASDEGSSSKNDPTPRIVPLKIPRRISDPLLQEIKPKLDTMIQEGVIRSVEDATWCSGLVITPKPNCEINLGGNDNGVKRVCLKRSLEDDSDDED